ncbi:hypothetical protein [Ligilactobacillus salivarius]|uniref:hypothetical protein n=1 Tax=Ligilactobacillus salivarius TaxID=1624 RepID=UPI0009D9AD7E|nr:hypothetical protein [Ligilactobacillus salivarius]ATP34763.1 hypothetical protein CR249_00130 [Ligilactobacillus salivarius]ATP36382.1 hypothetical protein CR249_08950 [Ligilactobacillus salivarius]OQR05177.1 hypothetical protein B6U49_03395 [Ligilactobacillus salivarius]
MKQVYFYDSTTKEFAGYDVIDDTAEIPANATLVEPVDENGVGLYDPTWNESTHSWDSLTEEEWKKKHTVPEVKPEPTQDQQMLATLTKQVMQLQVANVQQQKVNASLTKQLMDLAKGGN